MTLKLALSNLYIGQNEFADKKQDLNTDIQIGKVNNTWVMYFIIKVRG